MSAFTPLEHNQTYLSSQYGSGTLVSIFAYESDWCPGEYDPDEEQETYCTLNTNTIRCFNCGEETLIAQTLYSEKQRKPEATCCPLCGSKDIHNLT